ncbi:MAG: pectin esterase [Prevotella sp.]|nr:pectin esterase [Prevotella sp.]
MRTVGRLVSVLAVVVFLSAFRADNVITIFTIGDSTMANKDIKGGKLERGWGMMLRHCFSDDVRVDNHAQNGRSSKSFIDEGRWDKVLGLIKPGDYVFIQFGHNDEKPDEKRHTVPGSTFDDNLRKFVRETRERGGIPVLFNSVVRRNFSGSKTAVTDDDLRTNSSAGLKEGEVLIDTHGDYIVAPLNVAREMNVPFVDANRITHDLEQSLGVEGSKKLHMWYLPGETPSQPEGRQDNTHYNIYGASVVARLLADEASRQVPALKKYVRHYDAIVAADGSGQYFDLQKAVDNAPKGKSTIYVDKESWKTPVVPKGKKIKFVRQK